jgi:hypothetical protein
MTVCWREMICAWSWFSAIAVEGVRSDPTHDIRVVHTIALGESVSIASEAIIVHSLNHCCVPVQVVANIVIAPAAATAAVLQAINLSLPVLGCLLCFGELVLELLDFSVLLGIARLLLVLLAFVRNPVIQAHGCCKSANQRRRQCGHDESFLVAVSARVLSLPSRSQCYLEVLLLDP